MLRIQFASGLHLERYFKTPFPPIIKPMAPILLLAGNIGRPDHRIYRDFLHYCSRSWKHTVVVAGRSELYSREITTVSAERRLSQCEAVISEFQNVYFLERDSVTCEGVKILGVSWWSEPKSEDYRYIYTNGRLITEADTADWYARDASWLKNAVASCKGPTIVLTHDTCDVLHEGIIPVSGKMPAGIIETAAEDFRDPELILAAADTTVYEPVTQMI
jgi:hypothetical protein